VNSVRRGVIIIGLFIGLFIQGNQMRRLRRRNHEGAQGWVNGWARERARRGHRFMKLMK
jgi:hypothetical protein